MNRHSIPFLLLVSVLAPITRAHEFVPTGAGDALAVTTVSLPEGCPGKRYEATLEAEGGTAPYVWSAPTIRQPVVAETSTFSAAGTALDFREDDGLMEFSLPFPFPYFGRDRTTIWVDTNGRIALAQDTGSRYSYDDVVYLSLPTIAVLWGDLATNEEGCDVFAESGEDAVTIRWAAVDTGDGGSVNASATLHADGRIVLRYGGGNAGGGFAGFSAGDGCTHVDLAEPAGGWGGASDVTFSAPGAVLPAWLSLDPASGTLSGIPTAPCAIDVPVTVEDAAGATAARTLPVRVAALPLGFATDSVLPAGMTGVRYEQPIELVGGTAPYHVHFLGDPVEAGIPVDLREGVGNTFFLSGTPGYRDAGTYSISLRATDQDEGDVQKVFTWTVAPNPNRMPAIVSASPDTNGFVRVAEGGSADFSVEAADPDGDPLSCGWSVYDTNWDAVTTAGGCPYRFEPGAGTTGVFHVTAAVSDGLWTNEVNWTVFVGELEAFAITTESVPDAVEGQENYSCRFETSGGVEWIDWRLDSDDLPGYGEIEIMDGVDVCDLEIPRIVHPGDWTFAVRAEDRLGRVSSKAFTLHVAQGERTANSPIPVPHWWIDGYAPEALAAAGRDYEAAAAAEAKNGNGAVWQCYLAGLAPEDDATAPWWRTSSFTEEIRMDGETPVVTWTPDLGKARVYAVEGKENLSDETWGPTNAASRFFRVKVSLPEP